MDIVKIFKVEHSKVHIAFKAKDNNPNTGFFPFAQYVLEGTSGNQPVY